MQELPRILLLTGALMLAGCADRSGPAQVFQLGVQPDSPTGAIIAGRGDTLYSISQRYNLPMQDIISMNNIAPPYYLNVGQRLKLPAPRYYEVRPQDSLYQISRMFGASVTDIARINNLRTPYTLNVGQKLRLPGEGQPVEQARYVRPPASKPVKRSSPPAQAQKAPATSAAPATRSGEFVWPVKGKVISSFGPKENGLHNDGINITAPLGSSVKAVNDGSVVYVGNALESFGNLVILRHSNGWVTAYAHLDRVAVERGQALRQGDILGTVGTTGRVDVPQLHFEVRRGAEALNPQKYLTKL